MHENTASSVRAPSDAASSREPVARDTAPHYLWGDRCEGWHLARSASFGIIEERMPPGTTEVRHRHRVARQFFYVLAGRLVIEVAGTRHVVGPRSGLEIPPGAAHQVANPGPTSAEFLVASAPPSHGDREPADDVRA